ncbi:MAG: hypothetical protein IJM81_00150 [Prevotella sp.]|nr:hypothetical protein [Prevotella sp.]
MNIITIVIIALLAIIAGLGILLYKTVTRRNQTALVMAEIVRDLAKQNAEHTAPAEKPKENENTKSIQQ